MTMTMRPRLRKFVLTAHVVSSVGWLGAAAAYVVLAVLVLTTRNAQMVRAGIRMMELADLFVIVPLGAASLITGIVQSLGTTWGLFRHYWVVFKLLINVFALFLLVEYTKSLVGLAGRAAHPGLSGDVGFAGRAGYPVLPGADLHMLQDPGHIVHSAGGLAVLITATVLAVYKPRGMTRRGQRQQLEQRRSQNERHRVPHAQKQ
jgi:hypothetical protein